MIIGGIAVIARGVARTTRDIDATIGGAGTDPAAVVALAARHRIAPRIADAVEFARKNHVLLLRHAASGVDVDLSLAWAEFELEAIAAADQIALYRKRVPVARAEDLVVFKMVAFRDQDRLDVRDLMSLHRPAMDLARVRRLVALVAETLDDPERLSWLDRLLAGQELDVE